MNEVKAKLAITKKYLNQLYDLIGKQFNADIKQYDIVTQPGSIRIDALGKISQSIKNIEFELQQINDSIGLAEDMEKGLKENE
tara:strand:+ start:2872 stop:3120 length:249 start_codon:yes stop_codon:yes gene_type:complete